MGFLDGIQEVKSSGDSGGNYMKLQSVANQFSIVGSGDDGGVIQGMLGWANNDDGRRPFRWRKDDVPPRILRNQNATARCGITMNQTDSSLPAKATNELFALAKDEEFDGSTISLS